MDEEHCTPRLRYLPSYVVEDCHAIIVITVQWSRTPKHYPTGKVKLPQLRECIGKNRNDIFGSKII